MTDPYKQIIEQEIAEFVSWRDANEGLDRDVTAGAWFAHRRAISNEDKLDRIMRLEIPDYLHYPADSETNAIDLLEQVVEIIGQETA